MHAALYSAGDEIMERNDISLRAGWIGVFANAFLAALKIFVGWFFNSTAVLADGIDTATDIFTSLITLISSRISSRPPDETHPYGHEKIEAIAAKIVSFVIFYAGASLMVSSLRKIYLGQYTVIIGVLPIVVSLISIAAKTWLFIYKYRVGKKK